VNSSADTEVVSSLSPEIAETFNEPENNEDQHSFETDRIPSGGPPPEQ